MICSEQISASPSVLNSLEEARFSRLIHSSHKACLISAAVLSLILVVTLAAQLTGVLPLIASTVLFSILAFTAIAFITSLIAQIVYIQKFSKSVESKIDTEVDDLLSARSSTHIISSKTLTKQRIDSTTKEEYFDCILNCQNLYKNLKLKTVDPKTLQVLAQEISELYKKISDLETKVNSGLPLASNKELGLMFFPKLINPRNHPILGVIYRLHFLLTDPCAGAVWFIEMINNPSATRETIVHSLVAENIVLWNMFLTGWCLSTEMSRELVLSAIHELRLSTEDTQLAIDYLDQGNVLEAVNHCCLARSLPPLFLLRDPVRVREGYSWGLTQFRELELTSCNLEDLNTYLLVMQDYFRQLEKALPGTFFSTQFFQEDSSLLTVVNMLISFFELKKEMLEDPYAAASALITIVVFCSKHPQLLVKIKKLSPSKALPTAIHMLSIFLKGGLIAGVLTNKHLEQLSQTSGLSIQNILNKIYDGSFLFVLWNKIL